MRHQMAFRRGEYVAVSGRPGRVRGQETVSVSGMRVPVLSIEVLGLLKAVVQVPISRVEAAVERITEHQATALVDNPPTLSLSASWPKRNATKNVTIYRQAEFGRMGGLKKARNRVRAA